VFTIDVWKKLPKLLLAATFVYMEGGFHQEGLQEAAEAHCRHSHLGDQHGK